MDSLDTLVHTHRRGGDPEPSRTPVPARAIARDGLSAAETVLTAAAAPSSEPATQTLLLGRYRLLERLGAGGFGVVWRAHDELLHREVAVKRIWLGAGRNPIDSERASREALAGARLAHPAIVVLHEACATEDAFYLISELVHGDTLAELIAARALSDEALLEIGLALAEALTHAHERGVIHRDVKPQNVLVPHQPDERGGVAKLADFGGARLTGEDALTRTGDVLGTLAYMAPEQSEGRAAAEPADLYALALVLYEGLAGVHPVRGATPTATARRIGTRLTPLERERGDLPRSLTRAIDVALLPEAGRRGTLDDLHLVLEETLVDGLRRSRRIVRRRAPAGKERAPAVDDPAPAIDESAPAIDEPAPRQQHRPAAGPRLVLPRALWLGVALGGVVWQVWVGHPGAALLLCAAVAPMVVILPRRAGLATLAGALAPALGLAGLAGAFPALAGQRMRVAERAALAALGYWWLILAEPLLEERLWLGVHAGTPARAMWEGSLGSAATYVVGPDLSLGVLCGAVVWAVAAALLPWIVRGRSAVLDVAAAATWSAALVLASSLQHYGGFTAQISSSTPRGAVLGALFGAALAVAARALRGPV